MVMSPEPYRRRREEPILEPEWKRRVHEGLFWALLVLLFSQAAQIMPLPTFLLVTHLAAGVAGGIAGWHTHRRVKDQGGWR